MIIYDFEVFRYDWVMVYLDTSKRQVFEIVNSKEELQKFYNEHRYEVWVGYNSRNYDQWIAKSILCDFDPYEMNDWIINQDRHGYQFSNMLNKFPILNYDCSVFGRSLKQLEAFMGHNIKETSVPFNIDRKLTESEMAETIAYCITDVMETFAVFIENSSDYESQMEVIKKYNLPISSISKTQTQLSAQVLGATQRQYDDEFDITIPDTLRLGRYEHIKDHYINWSKNVKSYDGMELEVMIAGVPHTLGIGGLHGSRDGYFGEGIYMLADVDSYYPSLMIKYDFFSRSIPSWGKKRFIEMYHHRLELKAQKKKKEQAPYKLILNKTYGGLKDKYNALYDPLQANNICVAGQLFLIDLIDKIEDYCMIIQSNTDGVAFKLYREEDRELVISICNEWSDRTGMRLGFDDFSKIVQKDVNNYIMVTPDGEVKRKGAYVKELRPLDNHLPIVNKAIVDYFTKNIPVEKTISNSDKLIDFQFITKVSGKYDYAFKDDEVMNEKVYRVFASTDPSDGGLYKKHKSKETLDKTAGTPEKCFIDNSDITEKDIPSKLDRQWYVDLAKTRIKEFVKVA